MQKKRKRIPKKISKKKSKSNALKKISIVFLALIILIFIAFLYHYRHGIQTFICLKYNLFCKNVVFTSNSDSSLICNPSVPRDINRFNVRNIELLSKHNKNVFGIDVSEYQGNINWSEINCIEDSAEIAFVIIRATAGNNKVDSKFDNNWKEVRNNSFIRGAYHYYRPDEDPIEQANNFIQNVNLKSGDLPPILDIEVYPKKITMEQLRKNIIIWLALVERVYKIKPIIYSGQKFYDKNLKADFSDYDIWIANYNFFVENIQSDWLMWQFTEKGYVNGIEGPVDLNIYNSNYEDFLKYTKK